MRRHTTVMRLVSFDCLQWPLGMQSFPHVQYLELEIPRVWDEDLTNVRHIPHVRVILNFSSTPKLTAGSWGTLEVFCFGDLQMSIGDMDSFVSDTRDFAFMSESPRRYGASDLLMIELHEACRRQGKACHVRRHYDKYRGHYGALSDKRATYVTLSTNKEVAESFPVVSNDDKIPSVSFGRGKTLAGWEDFWPCDPCGSVKPE